MRSKEKQETGKLYTYTAKCLRKTFRSNGAMASRWLLIWVVSVEGAMLVYHKPSLRL